MNTNFNTVHLLKTSELKPHEQVIFMRGLFLLTRMFYAQVFTRPILVDAKSGVILDGHHRWWASKRLGLQLIPCYCVDYLNDTTVSCEPRRKNIPVSKALVIACASKGGTFPPKTTRHRYELPPSHSYEFKELL
jgi:hypothetical protein